jgi:hypothetical protein
MAAEFKLGQIGARLQLFIRVVLRGCRVVSVDTLECEKLRLHIDMQGRVLPFERMMRFADC